jgi:hypothetical protein
MNSTSDLVITFELAMYAKKGTYLPDSDIRDLSSIFYFPFRSSWSSCFGFKPNLSNVFFLASSDSFSKQSSDKRCIISLFAGKHIWIWSVSASKWFFYLCNVVFRRIFLQLLLSSSFSCLSIRCSIESNIRSFLVSVLTHISRFLSRFPVTYPLPGSSNPGFYFNEGSGQARQRVRWCCGCKWAWYWIIHDCFNKWRILLRTLRQFFCYKRFQLSCVNLDRKRFMYTDRPAVIRIDKG